MVFRHVNSLVPVAQLRSEVDRLMNDLAYPAARRWVAAGTSFPALNVWEDGDTIFAEAEVPGLKPEDLDISVVGGDLTIRGQRNAADPASAVFHRRERGTGEFNRVLRLPVDVDPARVEATLNNGVLLVKLPKADSAKPKKIAVSSGN